MPFWLTTWLVTVVCMYNFFGLLAEGSNLPVESEQDADECEKTQKSGLVNVLWKESKAKHPAKHT